MGEKPVRLVILLLVFMLSFILQTTILPQLRIYGCIPDLLLILVVMAGLCYGSVRGGMTGFAVGLLEDLLAGRYLGLGALSGLMAGYTAGYLEGKINRDNPFVPVSLVFLGSIIYNGIFLLGREVLAGFELPALALVRNLVPAALYNSLLTVVLYRLLFRVMLPGGTSIKIKSFGEYYR